ncbi:hypothetical protein ASG66_02140 [Bacillus sp. Leaf406]|nr:hypothetical protein ASG66_02140 [Bacillus sp. Leaf406]
MKMKHVGLVGVSAVGAALCYQDLIIKCLKRYGTHPEVTLHTMPINLFSNAELSKTGDILLSSLESLKRAGASMAALTANTTHYAIQGVRERLPLPLLDIVDLTVGECRTRNFKSVTVLGTFVTMQFGLYEKKLREEGIELLQPSIKEQGEIDRIISEELQEGIVSEESKTYIYEVSKRSLNQGSEAVILACTELPLLPFSKFDTRVVNPNELLVEEIIKNCLDGETTIEDEPHLDTVNGKRFTGMNEFFQYKQLDHVSEILKKGIGHLNAEEYDEALQYFEEASSIDHDDPEVHSWIAITLGCKMEESNALSKVKLLPKFEHAVQKCIELEPGSLIVRRLMGTRLIKIPQEFGGDLNKGVAELEYCVENGLKDPDLYKLISYTYLQLGEIEKSERALGLADQLTGEPMEFQSGR